jgi:phospholipase C
MPRLTGVSITFHTHDDNKDFDTILHVFVKNRLNTTQGSDGNPDFVSNLLSYQRYLDTGDLGDHSSGPYLAYGIGLAADQEFNDPSVHAFELTLMPDPVSVDDIVLPVVDIHILPNGNDRWGFDYEVAFSFDDDTANFTFSSKDAGLPGVLLDQDNRTYSGICAENPNLTLPAPDRPATKAFLRKVTLDLYTHDDNKDDDTRFDVEIVNRVDAASSTGIATGVNLFPGEEFGDGGDVKSVTWPSPDGNLTLNEIALADMVLPAITITTHPNGNDRWIFDYRLTFEFVDRDDFRQKPRIYSYRVGGVILDQDNNRHSGVYQGPSFPAVAARPAAPQSDQQVQRVKVIPLALVRRKLDEFINNRNGTVTDHNPPLRRIRLHNTGLYNTQTVPESYLDVRSIVAGRAIVNYVSSPTGIKQLVAHPHLTGTFFQDVNSATFSVSVDQTDPQTFTFRVDFETEGPEELRGSPGPLSMDFKDFSIALKLTLTPVTLEEPQPSRTVIDVLHWITEIEQLQKTRTVAVSPQSGPQVFHYEGTLLGQPVKLNTTDPDIFIEQVLQVRLTTGDATDLGGVARKMIRDQIVDRLTSRDPITKRTPRDDINSTMTSWLLGGVADDDPDLDGHNVVISDLRPRDDAIVITYTGPRSAFAPRTPADWPTSKTPNPAWDFSPGTLSNIHHIVVLTMENRSFDHMLGYLSLPVAQGGMGRTDVDGLKGGESNTFRGTTYPSVKATDTFFSPDPPHGFEPVHRAINGGLMDGFVKAYAEQNGAAIAGQIMGYHTAATVPTYDSLARDFAVGHRWFAPHPGPTFCNRFFELTGWLNIDPAGFWEFDNPSPLRPVFTKTIFDHLNGVTDRVTGQPVTWAYFEQGYCFLRFFEQHTFDDDNIVSIDDAERGFFVRAQAGNLPSVSFIDPRFVELPPDSNCDGAPADVKDGQDFVNKVVEAVAASPAWDTTMLIIVYDEHGGFYDHVPPSAAAKVSPELPIDTHGVRVPAFVVSPWVGAGTVFGSDSPPSGAGSAVRRNDLHFDHTSILKTIARRFLSDDPPYLGARYAAANDLSAVVGKQKRQTQFRPFIRYNFQFGASQMMLGVKDANPAPGAALWQLARDGSAAQDFSFEDAGQGFWYLCGRVSNLYLTARGSNLGQTEGGEPVAAVGSPPPIDPSVIQDVKFVPGKPPAGSSTTTPSTGTERQHWALRPLRDSADGRKQFLVVNRGVPGRALRPATSNGTGPVVLGNLPSGTSPETFAWKVNSPALPAASARWSEWESLGGSFDLGPGAASWASGRLDVFGVGADKALYHKWFDNTWSDWESLGGTCTSEPAAVSWDNGRIDCFTCFAAGTRRAMQHKYWDNGRWSDWESLGGDLNSGPGAASWASGRLDVFAVGSSKQLYHRWFGDGRWSNDRWESLGGSWTSAPAAVSWGDNRIDCFVRGADRAMWHKYWDNGRWSDWESLGGDFISTRPGRVAWGPGAASWVSGRLDVFGVGTDNALYHKWFDNGRWSDWESLGGSWTSAPAAVSWGNNRIDCFVRGTDRAIWHKWWG